MPDRLMYALLIDDDDVSRESVVRALERHCQGVAVVTARDGREALSKLRGENGTPLDGVPLIILLDINMPGMNGHEFLAELRTDPKLRHLVTFAHTTSESPRDISDAYAMNVAGYIVRSLRDREHTRLIEIVQSYQDGVTFPLPTACRHKQGHSGAGT